MLHLRCTADISLLKTTNCLLRKGRLIQATLDAHAWPQHQVQVENNSQGKMTDTLGDNIRQVNYPQTNPWCSYWWLKEGKHHIHGDTRGNLSSDGNQYRCCRNSKEPEGKIKQVVLERQTMRLKGGKQLILFLTPSVQWDKLQFKQWSVITLATVVLIVPKLPLHCSFFVQQCSISSNHSIARAASVLTFLSIFMPFCSAFRYFTTPIPICTSLGFWDGLVKPKVRANKQTVNHVLSN